MRPGSARLGAKQLWGDLGLLPAPKRILVVEDDDNAREALSLILESEGYEAPSARNGREAIARLAAQPHLILLDLIMPEMDGWEFLAWKKSNAAAAIPVFLLPPRTRGVSTS